MKPLRPIKLETDTGQPVDEMFIEAKPFLPLIVEHEGRYFILPDHDSTIPDIPTYRETFVARALRARPSGA